jgi:hypothetical protein
MYAWRGSLTLPSIPSRRAFCVREALSRQICENGGMMGRVRGALRGCDRCTWCGSTGERRWREPYSTDREVYKGRHERTSLRSCSRMNQAFAVQSQPYCFDLADPSDSGDFTFGTILDRSCQNCLHRILVCSIIKIEARAPSWSHMPVTGALQGFVLPFSLFIHRSNGAELF